MLMELVWLLPPSSLLVYWLSTALQVVSKLPEGPTIVTTYADIHRRSQLCALALQALGVR